jgi:hypothetical protein
VVLGKEKFSIDRGIRSVLKYWFLYRYMGLTIFLGRIDLDQKYISHSFKIFQSKVFASANRVSRKLVGDPVTTCVALPPYVSSSHTASLDLHPFFPSNVLPLLEIDFITKNGHGKYLKCSEILLRGSLSNAC